MTSPNSLLNHSPSQLNLKKPNNQIKIPGRGSDTLETMELTFIEAVDDILAEIDAVLADQNIELSQRPIRTALIMVQSDDFEISTDEGKTRFVYDGTMAFVKTTWFRSLYQRVQEWYRNRYGAGLSQIKQEIIVGVALIFRTPFRLEVPTCRCRSGVPGQTIWVSLPDRVESDEMVCDWLVNPPNLKAMSPDMHASSVAHIADVAGHLRFLYSNLLGVKTDNTLRGFLHGITLHLEQAADLILRLNEVGIQKCYYR